MIDDLLLFDMALTLLMIVMLLQFSAYFFYSYRRGREGLQALLAVCFLGFSGGKILYFVNQFVFESEWLWKLEISLGIIGYTLLVFVFERQIMGLTPWRTAVGIACSAALVVAPLDIAFYIGLSIYGAAVVVGLFLLYAMRQVEGKVKRGIRWCFIGGVIATVGVGFVQDVMVGTWRHLMELGILCHIIGFFMLFIGFVSTSSIDEFLWPGSLQSLFLIFDGVCVFSHLFETRQKEDEDLLGTGLASVLIVAKTIIQSEEPPECIEYPPDEVFLVKAGRVVYPGGKCVAILLAKKNLAVLRDKLQSYIIAFERKFDKILSDWKHDVAPFREQVEDLLQVFKPQGRWQALTT